MKSIKNIIVMCILALTTIIVGCSKKESELKSIAPKDSTLVFWCSDNKQISDEIRNDPSYKELIKTIKENKKIKENLKEGLEEFSKKSDNISDIFISKDDPIGSIEKILFESIEEMLIYTTSQYSENTKTPNIAFVAKMKDKSWVEKIKKALEKTKNFSSNKIDKVDGFVVKEKNFSVYINMKSEFIAISDSSDMISYIFKAIDSKPSDNITKNEKFAKIARDETKEAFLFIDSNIVKSGISPYLDNVKNNLEAIFATFSNKSIRESTAKIRVVLTEKSEILPFFKSAKLPNKAKALPNSDFYLALAMPDLSQYAAILNSPMFEYNTLGFSKYFTNIDYIEISASDITSLENIAKGKLPNILCNIKMKNVDSLLKDLVAKGNLRKQIIDGTECYCMEMMSTAYLVKVSDTQLSIISCNDISKALKSAKEGASVQNPLFDKMQSKSNAFCKIFVANELNNLFLEEAINNSNRNSDVIIMRLLMEIIKKNDSNLIFSTDNNIIECETTGVMDFTFEPITKLIKQNF